MLYKARLMTLLALGAGLCWGQPGPPKHECSVADFVGKYAFQAIGFDMRAVPPSPITIAGALEADGRGTIVAWGDWLTVAGDPGPVKVVRPNDLVATSAAAGSRVAYEVQSGCQMRITATAVGPSGAPFTVELFGGLADGGRKALMQIGTPVFIGTWTAESAEAEQNGKATRRLLERVAKRLSINP